MIRTFAVLILLGAYQPNPGPNTVNTAAIQATAVTNAKLATMAANTVKANVTGGSAVPTDVSLLSTNTASAAVIRDGSGNFSAGTITANVVPTTTGGLVAAANDTQSGCLALTTAVNRIVTSTSTNNSVCLPTGFSAGESVTIEVITVANAVHVFPASGGAINGLSTNAEWSSGIPPSGAAGLINALVCISTITNWDCSLDVAAPGHQSGSLTNGAANAGEVGEVIRLTRSLASAIALSNNTPCNVGANTCPATGGTQSIVLTPGDWSCQAMIGFSAGGATTSSTLAGSISKTSNTLSSQSTTAATPTSAESRMEVDTNQVFGGSSFLSTISIPPYQVLIASGTTQTLYLVAQSAFATSTLSTFGSMECRRMR